jgi:hypothetical protein
MSKENSVTYEELSAEHKQKYDEIKALFEADLIGSFERTRLSVFYRLPIEGYTRGGKFR